MDYSNLTKPTGDTSNMGGTTQTMYWAPVDDFATLSAPTPTPTTPAERVTISDDHVFNTGKCFKSIYLTLDKATIEALLQGDRDGKSFKNMFKGFTPGAKADLLGFISVIKNEKFIAIIKLSDTVMIQLGSADFYAEIAAGGFKSATNGAGTRGVEFDIESMAPDIYTYTGAVSLTPAV